MHYETSFLRKLQYDQFFHEFSLLYNTVQDVGMRKQHLTEFSRNFQIFVKHDGIQECLYVSVSHHITKVFKIVFKSRLVNKLQINKCISPLMDNNYHFAINKYICKLIKPIAENIACLQQNSTTLNQIFAKVINLYTTVKFVYVTKNYSSFKPLLVKIIMQSIL